MISDRHLAYSFYIVLTAVVLLCLMAIGHP